MLIIFVYLYIMNTMLKIVLNYNYMNYYVLLCMKQYLLELNINLMYLWFMLFMLVSLLNVMFYTIKKMYAKDKFLNVTFLYMMIWYVVMLLFLTEDMIMFMLNFESMLFLILASSMYFMFNNRFIIALYYLIMFSMISGLLCFMVVMLLFININVSSMLMMSNMVLLDNYTIIQYIWLIMYIMFGIKFPMYPFYFWLLAVHVEVSSEMSTVLASIILKAGFMGILKFLMMMLHFTTFINSTISNVLMIMGAFTCSMNLLLMTDYKKMMGSWSILHVNMTLLFVWYNNNMLLTLFMLSNLGHILSSSSFFLCMGFNYENFNNKHLFMISTTFNFNLMNMFFILLILNNVDFPFFLLFYVELLNFFAIIFISNYLMLLLLFIIIVLFMSSLLMYFMLNYYTPKWNNKFLRLDVNISEFNIFMTMLTYNCMMFWFMTLF